MARRRTTHHRRPTHHRRTVHHRRRHNPGNPRRRGRRNPSHKLPVKDLLLGGIGGLAVAGTEFALDGVASISNGWQAVILAGLGVVGGGLLALVSPPIGAGVFATGVAIGAYKGGTILLSAPSSAAKTTSETEGQALEGMRAQFGAVRAELGAIRAELGLPVADGRASDFSRAGRSQPAFASKRY